MVTVQISFATQELMLQIWCGGTYLHC